ncbi:hypothetical protein LZ32DRAFT_394712 [Colletotrichum eremochloae]|nr:hypothetical protein LZ32DRAFT_394712 [Colletotrichum eremochloae]
MKKKHGKAWVGQWVTWGFLGIGRLEGGGMWSGQQQVAAMCLQAGDGWLYRSCLRQQQDPGVVGLSEISVSHRDSWPVGRIQYIWRSVMKCRVLTFRGDMASDRRRVPRVVCRRSTDPNRTSARNAYCVCRACRLPRSSCRSLAGSIASWPTLTCS